jgi:hypothetical protein
MCATFRATLLWVDDDRSIGALPCSADVNTR